MPDVVLEIKVQDEEALLLESTEIVSNKMERDLMMLKPELIS